MSQVKLAEQQPAVNRTLLLVLLTATAATTFTGVLMVGALLLDLAAEFHSSVALVGQLVTAGALIWAMLGPICGALSDRYGRKPLMLLGLVAFGVFNILSSWATDLPMLFVGRMLVSVGGAFVATNVQTSVADYFPPEQRGRALGWVITAFSIAPIVGVPLIAFVAEVSGWRWSFRVIGVLVLIIGAVIYREFPRARPHGGSSYGATFTVLLRNRAVAGLLVCNVFERVMYGAISTYLAAFLMQTYGLSVGQVAPVISLVAVGTLLGTMLGGRVAGGAKPVLIFLAAQCVAALALPPLMLFAPAVWLSGLFAAAFGASNSFSRPSYMWMVTQVAARVRGAMMGLNVMTNQTGIVVGAALGGLVIAIGGYGELGLLSCAMGFLAAVSCRLLVRPEDLPKVGMEREAVAESELSVGVPGHS